MQHARTERDNKPDRREEKGGMYPCEVCVWYEAAQRVRERHRYAEHAVAELDVLARIDLRRKEPGAPARQYPPQERNGERKATCRGRRSERDTEGAVAFDPSAIDHN